jgi:glc operon protein GlcG
MNRLLAILTVALVSAATTATAQDSLTVDKQAVSLAAARKIIAASEAEALKRGLGVVIVVVDDAGNVVQLSRMDTAQVASVNVGIGKARTAAIYRRPSRVFEEQIRNGRVAALALADATPLQGGVPILIGGKVVGAVGVSGDSPQADEEIAMAGAKAVEATATAGDARLVTAVTLIHGIPGKEEELKQHLLSLTAPTRAEPGCLAYDLYQSPDQKHEFMRFEIWTSAEALEEHKKTPHLRTSFEKRQREGWTTQILTWRRVPDRKPE